MNTHTQSRFLRGSLFGLVALAMICTTIVFASRSTGERLVSGPDGTPAVVAIIDLKTVVEGLDAFTKTNEELETLRVELQGGLQRQLDAIEAKTALMDMLPDASTEYRRADDERLLMVMELRANEAGADQELAFQRSRRLRALYQDVRAAIATLSSQSGWDLVIQNDSVVELPEIATNEEMLRQISARRVLFAGTRLEVTQDVITFMNSKG